MGMYDSLYIKCPKCGKELEFQSNSGSCALFSFKENNLPPDVAMDMDGNIVRGGIYIYQVECEGKVINGVIVVAK